MRTYVLIIDPNARIVNPKMQKCPPHSGRVIFDLMESVRLLPNLSSFAPIETNSAFPCGEGGMAQP